MPEGDLGTAKEAMRDAVPTVMARADEANTKRVARRSGNIVLPVLTVCDASCSMGYSNMCMI